MEKQHLLMDLLTSSQVFESQIIDDSRQRYCCFPVIRLHGHRLCCAHSKHKFENGNLVGCVDPIGVCGVNCETM